MKMFHDKLYGYVYLSIDQITIWRASSLIYVCVNAVDLGLVGWPSKNWTRIEANPQEVFLSSQTDIVGLTRCVSGFIICIGSLNPSPLQFDMVNKEKNKKKIGKKGNLRLKIEKLGGFPTFYQLGQEKGIIPMWSLEIRWAKSRPPLSNN